MKTSKPHTLNKTSRGLLATGALLLAMIGGAQAASYTFMTVDGPASAAYGADVYGVNDNGQMVGEYYVAHGSPVGYVYTNGIYNTSINGPNGNGLPTDISNNGQVVGVYMDTSQHAYVYSNGNYTILNAPNATETTAFSINNSGQVVGNYYASAGWHSFVYSNGIYTTLNVPNATYTKAGGINDSGQLVGNYSDATGSHGFIYANGAYYTAPDAASVGLPINASYDGINNNGQVFGNYSDATGSYGFVYANGSYATIAGPNSTQTTAYGFNDNGQVVGTYTDATGRYGFLATPTTVPVPAAAWLFGSGLASLIGFARRQRA